jgi:hypothetical protein
LLAAVTFFVAGMCYQGVKDHQDQLHAEYSMDQVEGDQE